MKNPILNRLVRVFDREGEPIAGIHDYARVLVLEGGVIVLRQWNEDSEDGGESTGWLHAQPLETIGSIDTLGEEDIT